MASQNQAAGSGEITASRQRLSVAKNWEKSALDTLQLARKQVQEAERHLHSAREQVKAASLDLKNVEKKWEVINIDDYDSVCTNGTRRKRQKTNGTINAENNDTTYAHHANAENVQPDRVGLDGGANKIILKYPLDMNESVLEGAASGLKELGGHLLGVENEPASSTSISCTSVQSGSGANAEGVIIRQEDMDTLRPGQSLDYSLIDFWMQCNVHFFSSVFYEYLKNYGPVPYALGFTSGMDVFEKKFLFIPVWLDNHVALCVVVNPGHISNNTDDDAPQDEEHACILVLNSRGKHSKIDVAVAKQIREWLNFEWGRLGKGKINGRTTPFDKHMVLKSPQIPYQENDYDAGVFVCRYAYSLYIMRHQKFTFDDIEDRFSSLITNGPAFQFATSDIAHIRQEFRTLIDNLSSIEAESH